MEAAGGVLFTDHHLLLACAVWLGGRGAMAAVSSLPSRLHAGSGAMSSPRNAVGRLPPVAERPATNRQTDNTRCEQAITG